MTVHNFGSNFITSPAAYDAAPGMFPHGLNQSPGISQLSHVQGGRDPFDSSDFQAYPVYVEEFVTPAFRALDDAMKQYWTGIRVPTKNSYRFMRVKIAGGDKSLLIWTDDLVEGRVKLPVAALSRESHEFNENKYSPRYHSMSVRYLNSGGTAVARIYRPVPFLVSYKMNIWTETKRDAEYILYQVLTRFNSLAEFRMFDGKLQGNVQLRYNGCNDVSDKETGYDQNAKVRYEVSMVAESWLPLPETIVPTVRGSVRTIRENSGDVLLSSIGSV